MTTTTTTVTTAARTTMAGPQCPATTRSGPKCRTDAAGPAPMPVSMAPGGSEPFGLTVSCQGSRWTLAVDGELDLAAGDTLPELARELANQHPGHVDIDLARVTFIDGAGRCSLQAARRILSGAGISNAVIRASAPVRRLQWLVSRVDTTPSRGPLGLAAAG